MKPEQLQVQSAPHIPATGSTPMIMKSVILALLPAVIAGSYFFGFRALLVIFTCIISALISETIFLLIRRRKPPLMDGSALLTGLLLGLCLPVTIPLTLAALGSVVAIVLGKQIFGGLGYNIFNPALIGRAFLQASFPVIMTTWIAPINSWFNSTVNATTTATPLAAPAEFSYRQLLIGTTGGSIGETSAVALLLGGFFLLILKNIDWRIPTGFLLSAGVVSGLLHLYDPGHPDPLTQLLSGGLILGAFFMATDMVSSPINPIGTWIYSLTGGTLVIIFRIFGGQPGGVMYAILLVNALTPIIDRYTHPRPFGETISR